MDRAVFDEYNQAFTNKVYDLIPETIEQYVWRELHWAYEQGYAQGKAEALKTGKWIKVTQGIEPEKYMCSLCHRIIETYGIEALVPIRYPYCHCGAKMEVGPHEI